MAGVRIADGQQRVLVSDSLVNDRGLPQPPDGTQGLLRDINLQRRRP